LQDPLDLFISSCMPEVQNLILTTWALILKLLPGSIEQIDFPSKIIAYGYGKKYADLIVAISPFKTYVNLMFGRGVEISDADGLLEGTGKKARHIKLKSSKDLLNPAVSDLLIRARELYD
jgi:hypothetical protein